MNLPAQSADNSQQIPLTPEQQAEAAREARTEDTKAQSVEVEQTADTQDPQGVGQGQPLSPVEPPAEKQEHEKTHAEKRVDALKARGRRNRDGHVPVGIPGLESSDPAQEKAAVAAAVAQQVPQVITPDVNGMSPEISPAPAPVAEVIPPTAAETPAVQPQPGTQAPVQTPPVWVDPATGQYMAKRIIDGVEEIVTYDQLVADSQISGTATQKYQAAANMRRQTEADRLEIARQKDELIRRLPAQDVAPVPPPQGVQTQITEDMLNKAMFEDDPAAKQLLLERLNVAPQQAAAPQAVTVDEKGLVNNAVWEMESKAATHKVTNDPAYKPLFDADPRFGEQVRSRVQELIAATPGYDAGYYIEQATKDSRDSIVAMAQSVAPPPAPVQQVVAPVPPQPAYQQPTVDPRLQAKQQHSAGTIAQAASVRSPVPPVAQVSQQDARTKALQAMRQNRP